MDFIEIARRPDSACLLLPSRNPDTEQPPMNAPRFQRVKVIALAVVDSYRANRFDQTVLGLQPAYESGEQVGYYLGDIVLMLKSNWDAARTENPNPRITIEADDAVDQYVSGRKS
jgi:hypothetical protein